MIDTAPPSHCITTDSLDLVKRATAAGCIPVSFHWGPSVCAEYSAFMDQFGPQDAAEIPDDGRICDFSGLPVYPMECEGVALRTVKPKA